jgi:hypothetical protein
MREVGRLAIEHGADLARMIEDAPAALAMLAARGSPSTAACRRAIHRAVRPDGVQ